VLGREEARSLLARLDGSPWLVSALLYGGGLRLLEALRLRGSGGPCAPLSFSHSVCAPFS
jgi:hypothetical protein